MTEFRRRQIGRTRLRVTELGLGCATLGGSRIEVAPRGGEAIVRAAWAAGVRYIDTAPYYGFGQAERCVGDAMRERAARRMGAVDQGRPAAAPDADRRPRPTDRHHPLPFDPVYDYSYDGIMRSFEDSLQRLGLARIDILYVHDIGAMQHGDEAHPAADANPARQRLSRARRACAAAARCGRSASASTSARCCSRRWSGAPGTRSCSPAATPCWNRRRSTTCCRNAVAAGTSIVVGGPLNSGILAGRDTWNYRTGAARDRRPGQCDHARSATAIACRLPAAALQFPLAHPAVAAIIPGPRNVRRVPRQSGAAAPPDPGGAVDGFAAGQAASSRRPGSSIGVRT